MKTCKRVAMLLAIPAAVIALVLGTSGTASAQIIPPPPCHCSPVPFTTAEIVRAVPVPGGPSPAAYLQVSGIKRYRNMQIQLVPVDYVIAPLYREVFVMGCLSGPGVPPVQRYSVRVPAAGLSGIFGIDVVGSNKVTRIDVFNDGQPPVCGAPPFLCTM